MNSYGHSRSVCVDPSRVSEAFSTLHLLHSYRLFSPATEFRRFDSFMPRDYLFNNSDGVTSNSPLGSTSSPLPGSAISATISIPRNPHCSPMLATIPTLMDAVGISHQSINSAQSGGSSYDIFTNNSVASVHGRKRRSEKKPIPDEQKDEKYYERRKRNNQAAKKSRDARKIREDHIALRATLLEHENAVLKAQVLTLREEAQALRRMLISDLTNGSQSSHVQRSSISSVVATAASRKPTSC